MGPAKPGELLAVGDLYSLISNALSSEMSIAGFEVCSVVQAKLLRRGREDLNHSKGRDFGDSCSDIVITPNSDSGDAITSIGTFVLMPPSSALWHFRSISGAIVEKRRCAFKLFQRDPASLQTEQAFDLPRG